MKKEKTNVLTTADVAELCAVDPTTVLHWVKKGQLKSYHTPGGHNRILQEDLWDFIKENGLPFLGKMPRPDSAKKRILIVDDDPDFLLLLKKGLAGEMDWIIESADSSLEAGLKVGSWQPDLLIMDLRMPGFDGSDFCQFLKKNFNYQNLPVIVVTAFSMDEAEKKKIMELGVYDCLQKPFAMPDLVEKIRRFFIAN